jgi:hypothetical protein
VFETFRGISHLLMEKVTKELRRGGTAPTPARATPSAEPAAASRAEKVSASAPPSAPARTIAREAQETRAAEPAAPVGGSIDYGREIELPDEIPPRAPRETVSISASHAADGAVQAEPAPVASRPAPEPPRAAPEPTRAAPEPSRTATMTQPAAREAVAETRRPQRAADTAAAARPTAGAEPATVVVPVKIPAKGLTGEIVIRIVFERQD